MSPSSSLDELSNISRKEILRSALEANKRLQDVLHEKALKLELDLKELDRLLVSSSFVFFVSCSFPALNSGDLDC